MRVFNKLAHGSVIRDTCEIRCDRPQVLHTHTRADVDVDGLSWTSHGRDLIIENMNPDNEKYIP